MSTDLTELYAVGRGVSLPTVRGYADGKERPSSRIGSPCPKRCSSATGKRVESPQTKVSGNLSPFDSARLSFAQEVIQERSPHTITYSQTSIDGIFDFPVVTKALTKAPTKYSPKHMKSLEWGKEQVIFPQRHSCVLKDAPTVLPPIGHSERHVKPLKQKLANNIYHLMQDIPSKVDFISQLNEGHKPVHKSNTTQGAIQLGDVEYHVPLQSSYPNEPNEWCKSIDASASVKKITKGHAKWTGLPQPVEPPTAMEWSENVAVGGGTGTANTNSDYKQLAASKKSPLQQYSDEAVERNRKYINIVQEWYGKWGISPCLQGVTLASLLRQLSSINEGVQLTALATCGKVLSAGIAFLVNSDENSDTDLLTNNNLCAAPKGYTTVTKQLTEVLEELLDSKSIPVQVGAAIVICALGVINNEIEEILLGCLTTAPPAECWAAVQCLSHIGICRPIVVQKLLTHLHAFYNSKQQSQAAKLLGLLSHSSKLVHAMVAEELKSTNWQERVAACKLMPLLHEGINKDMCDTLLYLMLEDWNPQVREAAASALGETGNGKALHDELQRRLSEREEGKRMDALRKIYALKLMTPKLLPVFLSCFSDDFISIKIEAISIAGSLKLRDGSVIDKLLSLMHDNCWKIRAHTLKALGEIGFVSPEVTNALLWCARNDLVPVVRREACHSIACLGITTNIVITTLKDMLELDDDTAVQREVAETLIKLGFAPEPSHSTADIITEEIRKLSTQEAITQRIMLQSSPQSSQRTSRRASPTTRSTTAQSGQQSTSQQHNQRKSPSHLVKLPETTWSPDKTFIDAQLETIKKRCIINS